VSLAWGSLVVLLLLLPGVLFFVGIYIPEKFTRETAERSPLGQLAAVLVISFGVQGVLYWLLSVLCRRWSWLPCVDLHLLTQVLLLDKPNPQISAMLTAYWGWILLYLLFAALLGAVLGYVVGRTITGTSFVGPYVRGLSQHPWVYNLSVGDNFTIAYVMTNVRHEDRVKLAYTFDGSARELAAILKSLEEPTMPLPPLASGIGKRRRQK
jgi:hypothetical protein